MAGVHSRGCEYTIDSYWKLFVVIGGYFTMMLIGSYY